MRCLVFVKFLPGVTLPPDELISHINTRWSWIEDTEGRELKIDDIQETTSFQSPRSAIYIADYESIEQLALDLAIMPGAGIYNVEIVTISEEGNFHYPATDVSTSAVISV